MRVCDHGQYEGARCRKRATVAIGERVPFGCRIGPNGDEPLYVGRTVFRCPDHATVKDETGRMTMRQYAAALELQAVAR